MIASMAFKNFLLLALGMAVRVASQEDLVCPYDFSILPVGDAGEIDNSRRYLQQEGVVPPIEIIKQGGDYVDFVVHNTAAFTIVADHLFVQHAEGSFRAERCNVYEGLAENAPTDVKRAQCVGGEYAIVRVYARTIASGEHRATIPPCCYDPFDVPDDANTLKFAYELECVNSCDNPVSKERAKRRSLQEEIIKDMMPASSGKCSGVPSNSTYAFQSSQAESQWASDFAKYEEELFLAKMQHIDNDPNKSWTIRFGQAGNIYSMVGPMGETVPPQDHKNAPWVNEVWQAVQPLGHNFDHDNDPNTKGYSIHEAGTYTNDSPYTEDKPFYSPTLGSYCHDEDGECGFATWGQHANLPTPWKSPMLYLNRYVNCGNGVFEYTTLRHNIVGSDTTFGYLNVPWGGIRRSVLGDVVLTNKYSQELEVVYPLEGWSKGSTRPLKDTMGFTVFAEDLPKDVNPLHNQPYTNLPAGLTLVRNGKNCFCEGGCKKPHNRYVCPLVSQTTNIGWSPNRGDPGLVVRLAAASLDVEQGIPAGVRHWAGNGKLYFYQNPDINLSMVNAALKKNEAINVYHYYPASGKPEQENLALGHVHGGQNGGGGHYPRVRYGMAGRDFNVYTVNDTPSIGPGSSYYYRQYFMMDSYPEMKAKGIKWANEVTKATKDQGSIAGRTVTLYQSLTSSIFGHAVAGETCRNAKAVPVCKGVTTPQSDWKPLFAIHCGDSYAVTDDLYYFSPPGTPVRSYACDGLAPEVRPVWTLLGYFPAGSCDAIASDFVYDGDYC